MAGGDAGEERGGGGSKEDVAAAAADEEDCGCGKGGHDKQIEGATCDGLRRRETLDTVLSRRGAARRVRTFKSKGPLSASTFVHG